MITKALINRFLRNECNEEERSQVLHYLDTHPEEWESLLPEEEFNREPAPAATMPHGEELYQVIRGKLFRKKATARKLVWALAAASCFGLILMIYQLQTSARQNKVSEQVAYTPATGSHQQWITKENHSRQPLSLVLPDSSLVTLEPGSVLQYRTQFNAYASRLLYLKGKGLFEVKKDKAHPFTVISDAIATTALGTSFTVSAPENAARIVVHLYTGKVEVRSSEAAAVKMNTAYYLQPGEELTYEKAAFTATIKSNRRSNELATTTTPGKDRNTGLQPNWYKFGGQPLSQVFEQLSSYYGVAINYRRSDVDHRYFTGKFSASDSVEVILKDIALLHNLHLKKENGVYVLRKNRSPFLFFILPLHKVMYCMPAPGTAGTVHAMPTQ